MNSPLVSIMMPCYNSNGTLPLALASVLAQTYENWECILVDDGSSESPQTIVEAVDDTRIKLITLKRNYGRAVARQAALDHARGEFLAMLDADDWIYPTKLSRQLEVMHAEPRISLVSSGMAIVNPANDIVGVRATGLPTAKPDGVRCFSRLQPPNVAHAPSMIRMSVARGARYDPRFALAEDVDFLLQIMLNQYYFVMPDVDYAYSEIASASLKKITASLKFRRVSYRKYHAQFPLQSRTNMVTSVLKEGIYRSVFAIGLGEWVIRRRSTNPTLEQRADFLAARAKVVAIEQSVFEDPGNRSVAEEGTDHAPSLHDERL